MLLGGERGSCDVTDDLSNCFPTLCVCVCVPPCSFGTLLAFFREEQHCATGTGWKRGLCVCVCVRWKTVCVCHIYFKRLEV